MVFGVLAPASASAGVVATPVGTFSAPSYMASPPGDAHRLFVVQQGGQIALIKDGAVQQTPFLNISGEVKFVGGEQGLLSMAFPPDYASSHRFYVYYTDNCPDTGCDEHVSEFTANAGGDTASEGSEHVLITIPHPNESNHNGGQLQFGPDGDLYISVGDGGGGDDTEMNAQSTKTLLGKLLRVSPGPLPTPSPPATRSAAPASAQPAPTAGPIAPRSGPTACATRGGSHSTAGPATWSSPTSAKTGTRRSTSLTPVRTSVPTTAGLATRDSSSMPPRPRQSAALSRARWSGRC
jgi:Glucose / Sorbosone dehydrogenase